MRTRDFVLAPILSCLLALPASVFAAPADGDEAEASDDDGEGEEEADPAKLEEAKDLYKQAEKLAKKKKWKEAEELYEQAYYLVPGKHGFAHKVGLAAHEAGDCDKAVEYMVHFLTYAVDEKFEGRRNEARAVLVASIEAGCTTEADLNNIHLSPDEREEKARELYLEAEEYAAAEQWAEAAATYEEAYYLVPHKVGFSHKVGMAAYKLGDCDMAHEYLVHYVDYADPAKDSEKMAEATDIVEELENSGCVSSEEMAEHHLENPFEINPEERRDDRDSKGSKGGKGLLIGGSALAVVGLGGLGVGVAGFVMAGSSQSKLDALASTDTATGLPDADYSCRGVSGDACPPTLESQVRTRQLMGIIGVSAGAALLAGGAALIALHFVRGGKSDEGGELARLDALGPMLLPGGGGASARLRF